MSFPTLRKHVIRLAIVCIAVALVGGLTAQSAFADKILIPMDLKQTNLKTELPRPSADDPILRGLRSAVRDGTDLRVVLDLKAPVRPKSFLLKPNDTIVVP